MALNTLGSFTLLEINIGLALALGFLNPLALQLDAFIGGQFGLGPFLADLQAQFSAAIAAVANISFNISFNGILAIQGLINAMASLAASLQALLAIGLPAVTLGLTAQLSAVLALTATLQLKIGGIRLLIEAALAIKIPAIQFIAQLTANLNLGPVHLLSFTGDTLVNTGADIAAEFASGLGPPDRILPGPFFPLPGTPDLVSGVILVTKDPAAFAGISAIIKTS